MKFEEIVSIYRSELKPDLYLVLNPIVPSYIVTNINGVLLLKSYSENKSFSSITDEFIELSGANLDKNKCMSFLENAKQAHLFDCHPYAEEYKVRDLYSIYLNMTKECNLKCTYCYAEERIESNYNYLTYEDYTRLIDELPGITSRAVDISFTGGEPLLNPITKNVAKYAKSHNCYTRLLTNGTLINKNNISELVNSFDFFKISLDGSSADKHNFYRGKNSYERTVAAIDLLKEHNANFLLAMVVTKDNMYDVPAMSEKWGNLITFQPLFPLGKAKSSSSQNLTGSEYFKALTLDSNVIPYSEINTIIESQRAKKSLFKCAIGDGEVSISCSGDVYPCQLLHKSEFLLGNVHDSSLHDLYYSEKNMKFKSHTVDKIQGCKTCDFRYLCSGSCQARHFAETGSIDKAGEFCEYEKKGIVEGLIASIDTKVPI